MKKNQLGFGHIELILALVVIIVIGLIGFKVLGSKKDTDQTTQHTQQTVNSQEKASQTQTLTQLEIKNWPVKIAAYNSTTQLAGDVYMNKNILVNSRLGLEQIPLSEAGRQRTEKNSGRVFTTPTIDFLTRPGAPLLSVSNGYVMKVEHQVENGRDDYEMHVVPDNKPFQWMVVYDHLVKPSIKEGETIKAGQQIGETGPVGSGAPYNFIELQVNYFPSTDPKHQSQSEGRCPSSSIAANVKKTMSNELLLITSGWEALRGDTSIYNEGAWVSPGCLAEKLQV